MVVSARRGRFIFEVVKFFVATLSENDLPTAVLKLDGIHKRSHEADASAKWSVRVELGSFDFTDSKAYQNYTMGFSFDVTLKSDGGALILDASTPTTGDVQKSDWQGDNLGGDVLADLNNIIESISSTINDDFNQIASQLNNSNYSDISTNLDNAFAGLSASVIFPGTKDFDYKSVRFSSDSETNLQATVSY